MPEKLKHPMHTHTQIHIHIHTQTGAQTDSDNEMQRNQLVCGKDTVIELNATN